jgi:hypothetical protein
MDKYVIEIERENKSGETYVNYPILVEDAKCFDSPVVRLISYIEDTPMFSSPQEAIGFWYNKEYLNFIHYEGIIRIRKISIIPTDKFRPMPMIEQF